MGGQFGSPTDPPVEVAPQMQFANIYPGDWVVPRSFDLSSRLICPILSKLLSKQLVTLMLPSIYPSFHWTDGPWTGHCWRLSAHTFFPFQSFFFEYVLLLSLVQWPKLVKGFIKVWYHFYYFISKFSLIDKVHPDWNNMTQKICVIWLGCTNFICQIWATLTSSTRSVNHSG